MSDGRESRRRLDAIGRLHFAARAALRDAGYPGFLCQLHVWLGGRLDPAELRRALDRLGERRPLLTARLDCGPGPRDDLWWEPRPDATCPLEVVSLVDSDAGDDPAAAVRRYAEALMRTPIDLARGEPVSWHLLQLPGDRDAVVMQYDHTLIGDAHAATLLLEELSAPPGTPAPMTAEPDEIASFLQNHGVVKRWLRAIRVIAASVRSLPALKLAAGDAKKIVHDTCRIAVRSLDEASTRTFADRVKRACGFPNLSMAVLASCFRVLERTAGTPAVRTDHVAAAVGYSIRPATRERDPFRTFGSEMILTARLDELEDRDALTRLLVRRMRGQVRRGFDLGSLQLAWFGSRNLKRARRVFEDGLRDVSFSYGYFRPVDDSRAGLCGVPIERAYHLIMPWSPPGLTVSANACHGRLQVAVTSGVEAVPEAVAGAFADGLVEDIA